MVLSLRSPPSSTSTAAQRLQQLRRGIAGGGVHAVHDNRATETTSPSRARGKLRSSFLPVDLPRRARSCPCPRVHTVPVALRPSSGHPSRSDLVRRIQIQRSTTEGCSEAVSANHGRPRQTPVSSHASIHAESANQRTNRIMPRQRQSAAESTASQFPFKN